MSVRGGVKNISACKNPSSGCWPSSRSIFEIALKQTGGGNPTSD